MDNLERDGYLDKCQRDNYQISLLVLTYKADYKKLFSTIYSGLIQENVDLQIVIADDGTENFDAPKIVEYFEEKNFHDYVIVSLETNGGTVKNFINGLKYCKGEYTKPISPGDLLNGSNCLSSWVQSTIQNEAVVSFADCIHYCFDNESVKAISVIADPQNVKDFYKCSWAYNYLVFDDIVTGACTLAKTEKLIFYSKYLVDKVKFAEDNVYRLMAYRNEPAFYFERDAVLYEHGLGISTSGNDKWLKRIFDDFIAADSIMLTWENDSVVAKQFKKIANIRTEKRSLLRKFKVILFILSSGKYKYMWNRHFKPRYTNDKIDTDYAKKILELS